MNALELKIPPPIAALGVAAAMWGVSRVTVPPGTGGLLNTLVALGLAIVGASVGLAGNIAFRRAKTTINPLRPGDASYLVTEGVYRFTRNPVYLGQLLILVGWAIFLANPWCAVGPVTFAAYITRFQIRPEERALASLFGNRYAGYAATVRRWI